MALNTCKRIHKMRILANFLYRMNKIQGNHKVPHPQIIGGRVKTIKMFILKITYTRIRSSTIPHNFIVINTQLSSLIVRKRGFYQLENSTISYQTKFNSNNRKTSTISNYQRAITLMIRIWILKKKIYLKILLYYLPDPKYQKIS